MTKTTARSRPQGSAYVNVVRMMPEHVESVVRVHMESFPGFFLSSLGPGFLRLFYKGVLNDASGMAVVAERDDVVVGFVCGSIAPRGFYRRLFKAQWWRFGWAAVGALSRRPSMIRHFLGAVRSRVTPGDGTPTAELMSLAVSPDAQGMGVGAELVLHFVSEARRRGAPRVTLTTDRQGNQHVNSFYHRLGFTLAGSLVTNTGREMNLYEINTSIISSIGSSLC